MSEILILNKSFKANNESRIYVENNNIIIDSTDDKKEININDITNIYLINSRCPSPIWRFIPFVIEIIAFIFLTIALILRNNKVLLIVFLIIAVVFMLGAAIISKMVFKKSPDAVEMDIVYNRKKIRILGCRTTEADYNKALRIAKECKKINKIIILDFQTKK